MAAAPNIADNRLAAEAWAGEVRINLIRLVAVLAFYLRHLYQFHFQNANGELTPRFHAATTWLIVASLAIAALVHVVLSRNERPPGLSYLATAWDLFLVLALSCLASRGGGFSVLPWLFLLVVASSPLRGSLGLVYFAAFGSVVGLFLYYLYLVGGSSGRANPIWQDASVNAVFQIQVVAIFVSGLLAGQSARQVQRLCEPEGRP